MIVRRSTVFGVIALVSLGVVLQPFARTGHARAARAPRPQAGTIHWHQPVACAAEAQPPVQNGDTIIALASQACPAPIIHQHISVCLMRANARGIACTNKVKNGPGTLSARAKGTCPTTGTRGYKTQVISGARVAGEPPEEGVAQSPVVRLHAVC